MQLREPARQFAQEADIEAPQAGIDLAVERDTGRRRAKIEIGDDIGNPDSRHREGRGGGRDVYGIIAGRGTQFKVQGAAGRIGRDPRALGKQAVLFKAKQGGGVKSGEQALRQIAVADQRPDGQFERNVPAAGIAASLAFPAHIGQQGLAEGQLRRGQQILIAQFGEFAVQQGFQLEILRLHVAGERRRLDQPRLDPHRVETVASEIDSALSGQDQCL